LVCHPDEVGSGKGYMHEVGSGKGHLHVVGS